MVEPAVLLCVCSELPSRLLIRFFGRDFALEQDCSAMQQHKVSTISCLALGALINSSLSSVSCILACAKQSALANRIADKMSQRLETKPARVQSEATV